MGDPINEFASYIRKQGAYYNYNPIHIGKVTKINPLEIEVKINSKNMILHRQNLQINSLLNIRNDYLNTTLNINDEVLMYHNGDKFIVICKVVDA